MPAEYSFSALKRVVGWDPPMIFSAWDYQNKSIANYDAPQAKKPQ